MPFVPALNTSRVTIDFISNAGETAANVFHVLNLDPPLQPTQHAALFAAIDTWLSTYWAPAASNTWQSDLLTARDLTVEDGAVDTHVNAISGTRTSPALPAQDTAAMSLRTGFSGRSRRGRMYHVGLTEDMVVNSTIQSAASTQLLLSYDGLAPTLFAADWQLVIASFVSNGAPRATALRTPVTDVIMTDVIVDSMDTRKPR